MRIKFKSFIILLSVFLFNLQAFGHGEDKPGPHGGYIRMPGSFHTELVQTSHQEFKVYLLDMNWKNPTINNSSVEATVLINATELKVSCAVQNDYFICNLPKGKTLQNAKKISVKAKRDKVMGGLAEYELPFKFFSH